MTLAASRKTLIINGLCLLLVAWLYGGDLSDALQAREAEVSAFTSLPPLIPPIIVLTLGTLALGVVVWGLLRRRGDDFKGYRLLPIVLVAGLFMDLVFAERRSPLDSTDLASMSLQRFHGLAQELATADAVPAEPAVLHRLLEDLGRPPYLVRGKPADEYTLQVRQDCEGPVRSASGLQPGTFIYCVAPERKGAWITLVGLPAEERFGLPDVLSVHGEARFLVVQPSAPEPESAGDDAFRDLGPTGGEVPPATPPSPEPVPRP
ncbi:MAG TPA: hypothetical protein VF815_15680 [Myxococcaceae bacterium]|jgi:hypothetical protein